MDAIGTDVLSDPDLFRSGDHVQLFEAFRRDASVLRTPGSDDTPVWHLTRYEDVADGLRDHGWLSSRDGAVMGSSYRSARDSASGAMLVASDLPRHRQFRQLFLGLLSTTMIERIRVRCAGLVERELQRIVDDGGGDFARTVARQLPVAALCELLGVGETEANQVVDLTDAVVGYRDDNVVEQVGDEATRLACAQIELVGLLDDLLSRTRMGDHAPSTFLAAEQDGTLNRVEVIYNLLNLVFGGNETSAHTASGGLRLLMGNENAYGWLAGHPDRVRHALPELLRRTTVAAYLKRVATGRRALRTDQIERDDVVVLWLYSANHDETAFENPYELRLDRHPTKQIAFGQGIHRCVGATPALVELQTLFEAVSSLRRIRLEPSGEPVRLRSNFIRGYTSLPVVVRG